MLLNISVTGGSQVGSHSILGERKGGNDAYIVKNTKV